jgi:hypothetical protein
MYTKERIVLLMIALIRVRLWAVLGGIAALLIAGCSPTTLMSTTSSSPGTAPTATATTPPPTIQVVSASQSGKDATAAKISVTATCPTGATLVSGGYTLQMGSTSQLITISADYPSASNAWTATELNPQSGGNVTLTAFADCAQATTAIAATLVTANSDGNGNATAACATGQSLTGGGFNQAPNGANVIAASYPVANAWQTSQPGSVQHNTYTAYAICATSDLASASLAMAGATVSNNTSGSAAATCPGGQILVGGGYREMNGATPIITDLHFGTMQTTWIAGALNQYMQPTSGPGGPPPPPNPLQLTTFGVCVSAA